MHKRTDARPPWPCPRWNCGARAGEPCRTNRGCKIPTLPQMHIVRWEARPKEAAMAPTNLGKRVQAMISLGHVPDPELQTLVDKYTPREWQVSDPDAVNPRTIDLLLDGVLGALDPNADPCWLRGALSGVELCLSILLSPEEEAAENILQEALTATDVGKRLELFDTEEHAEPEVTLSGQMFNGIQVGDLVDVELEGPGPGTRDPRFLRTVEGKVVHLPTAADGTFGIEFRIDEDNLDDWLAIMPDGVVDPETDRQCRQDGRPPDFYTIGSVFIDCDVYPEWIKGKVVK